ncbi:MAG: restriction endonuclease subunit S [Candidatus Kapaibacterium sp.]
MSLNLVNLKAIIHKPISGEWGESEGDVNIIRTTNFTNEGRLNLSNVVKRNIDVDKITRKKLLYGDTIIEKSGGSLSQPVGRVIYFDQIDGTYLCNNFTSVIRAKSNIDSRYLFWFLFNNHQNQNTLKYQNKTTGIINLQLERYIEELQIPLPPLPIQKRIAEILDAADALRRKDQELLKKYDELAQAVFIDMFGDPVKNEKGWEVRKLGEVCTKITDGTHDTPERLTEGIKFITGKHIRPFSIDYNNSDYVTIKVHTEIYKRCNPEYGDILYTNIGVNYATAAMNTVNYEFSMKNVALLKYNRTILSGRFLEFLLNNEYFKDKLRKLTGIGGAQQFLSLAQIKSIPILLPSIDLQTVFENKIYPILLLIEKQNTSNQVSSSLFHSLLQKAFSGELVV